MRTTLIAHALCIAGFAGVASAQMPPLPQPQDRPPYSITLSGPAAPLMAGAPIRVEATVNVTGPKKIAWRAEAGNTDYKTFRFTLNDRHGKELPRTDFQQVLCGEKRPKDSEGGGSSFVSSLAPGDSLHFAIDVRRLYEIEEPGTYELIAERPTEDNKTVIRSNVLTLKILP